MSFGPEVEKAFELGVNLVAEKTGYKLDAAQIAEAVGKLIGATEGILNAWPEAKKAGAAEAAKVTDMESAEKWNKEH